MAATSTRQKRGYIHTAKPQGGWKVVTKGQLVVATGGSLSAANAYLHDTTRRSSGANLAAVQSAPMLVAVELEPCDSVKLKVFGQGANNATGQLFIWGGAEIGAGEVEFINDPLMQIDLALGEGTFQESLRFPHTGGGRWADTLTVSEDTTPSPGAEVYLDAADCAAVVEWTNANQSRLLIEVLCGTATGLGLMIEEG